MKYQEVIQSAVNNLKKRLPHRLIASVPPELKERFNRLQLINTIQRFIILCIVVIFTKLIDIPDFSFLIEKDNVSPEMQNILNFQDNIEFSVIILFLILAGIFSKLKNNVILRILSYLFIIYNFITALLIMPFIELDIQVVQFYFWYIALFVFLPDVKPYIFIPYAVLYCLSAVVVLSDNFRSIFVYSHSKLLVINIFIGVLLTKILLYNEKVKTFVNMLRINALNEELTVSNKKLEALSTTDELTKLNNRRSFLEYMDMVWKQNYRLKLPLNVLMIDVDYFKKYNDSLGHLEGDKALIAIAQCLKNNVKRETDFVARFGGEEFVCLFPFIEKDEALNMAKELVQSIENMKIPHPKSEHSKYVTISVGMATVIPDDNNSKNELLDEADKALYMAKQAGRNRVVVYQ